MNRRFVNPFLHYLYRLSAAFAFCRFVMVVILIGAVCGCKGWLTEPGDGARGPGITSQNPNIVGEGILAPRLLKDEEVMSKYIEAFPSDEYSVCRVPDVGDFYVDSMKDYIKERLCKGEIWELWNYRLLNQYIVPGSTVIDVGAHIGTHTIVMSRKVGASGRVYAFEPQRKIFRELVHNLRLNQIENVVPLRYAIGSEAAIVEMNPVWNKNEGGTAIGKGGDKAELRTIDSFCFSNVSLIKIDVERYEGHVLDGCRRTIRAFRPVILVEIAGESHHLDRNLAKNKKHDELILGKLKKLGYTVKKTEMIDYLAIPKERGWE